VKRLLFVGIAGGSCSGKTTLALRLRRTLAPLRVRILHMDHFYKPAARLPKYWSPTLRGWNPGYNHPGCFNWRRARAACRRMGGTDILVLEGLMALHDPVLRARMDLRVFVTCPEPERRRRIFRRGVRGWSRDRHRRYWEECVERGFRRHVLPTRRHAALVVSGASGTLRRSARVVGGAIRRAVVRPPRACGRVEA
jgi:uridine kinase